MIFKHEILEKNPDSNFESPRLTRISRAYRDFSIFFHSPSVWGKKH